MNYRDWWPPRIETVFWFLVVVTTGLYLYSDRGLIFVVGGWLLARILLAIDFWQTILL